MSLEAETAPAPVTGFVVYDEANSFFDPKRLKAAGSGRYILENAKIAGHAVMYFSEQQLLDLAEAIRRRKELA